MFVETCPKVRKNMNKCFVCGGDERLEEVSSFDMSGYFICSQHSWMTNIRYGPANALLVMGNRINDLEEQLQEYRSALKKSRIEALEQRIEYLESLVEVER
jgi:hypothetical protein